MNSIVRSKSVDGKVDVWSAEGVGTEIKVTFTAEAVHDAETTNYDTELVRAYDSLGRPNITLAGFDDSHRGIQLLRTVLATYLVKRWNFVLADNFEAGDIVIINEDYAYLTRAIQDRRSRRPLIILSSNRGDPKLMNLVGDYEKLGGFCRVVYKPAGPCRITAQLKLCLHALNITKSTRPSRNTSREDLSTGASMRESPSDSSDSSSMLVPLPRRYSEESGQNTHAHIRPPLGPRAITVLPLSTWSHLSSTAEQDEPQEQGHAPLSPAFSQSPSSPTIAIGTGGTLLKSSTNTLQHRDAPIRVLVVEDNAILRNLLYVIYLNHHCWAPYYLELQSEMAQEQGTTFYTSSKHMALICFCRDTSIVRQ